MHTALQIDEIFREIFRFLLEDDLLKGRSALVSVARTCQCWRDAALDLLWECISSFEPLLVLLADKQDPLKSKTAVAIARFKVHARRVKHLNNRGPLKYNELVDRYNAARPFSGKNILLPNLKTVKLTSKHTPPSLLQFAISPSLSRLDLDLGFRKGPGISDDSVCNLLLHAKTACPSLRHLNLRGWSSERLNSVLASMNDMETVTLRMGRSLLPETVVAMMTFPHLMELDIHAGHIPPEDLEESLARIAGSSGPLFCVLENLHLQAATSTILLLLRCIESDVLDHLRLDLDDRLAASTSAWDDIFETICSTAARTLTHLSLEHHFELPTPGSSFPQLPDGSQPIGLQDSLLFESLAPLQQLRRLCRFSCDLTVPPSLRDQDVEKMLSWWPDLKQVEINFVPVCREVGFIGPSSRPSLTAAALVLIAQRCPSLERVVLPLVIDQVPAPLNLFETRSELTNLTIADLRISDSVSIIGFLKSIFPRLKDFDSPSDDNQIWTNVKSGLL